MLYIFQHESSKEKKKKFKRKITDLVLEIKIFFSLLRLMTVGKSV